MMIQYKLIKKFRPDGYFEFQPIRDYSHKY